MPPLLSGFVCAYHPATLLFEFQANHLSFYFICSQICTIFCIFGIVKKNENKLKEAGFGQFFIKKYFVKNNEYWTSEKLMETKKLP